MNIRFLETFVWLAKLRNFRLTAERLHTTQAAVSSRIASLEQDFGVRLFDRSAREVALTADGSKALVYAERMVKLMREMKDDMSDKQVYAGVIRIGVIESIVHSWFPDFLGRLHKTFPRLQIEIASDTTIHLHEQFSKGNLDLVLQAEPVIGPQVSNIALCEFPMRWVGSPKLDIGSETLSMSDLAAFPVISFARNSGPHAVIERLFSGSERGNLHVNCIASVATMIRLATDGFGIAAVPPAIIQRELNEETLHVLRVDTEFPALALIACFRSDHENPLTETVARIAQQTASDFALNWGHEIARLPSPLAAGKPAAGDSGPA
ncbi:LysR family transcriptional regulator [Herbaspirillum sp. WKF16]|uniref:LysR family transcriptional regulator n=1 Tax=Herbaspirillum sp. WKF16 TaxID=3028312 RepID=UPI0023A9946A|nr:LysR family transcriptional regulator [Herbaspirillum sp. WKF16]WDZ97763.1 LysR family transcriptional regulator [Herbaspirillum sp. WKF16]